MELNEAFARIIGRHIMLIALLVAVGFVGAGFVHHGDRTQYRASARVVLDTGDPATQVAATIDADTARALATSESLISGALQKIGVQRDPLSVADGIAVRSLGSSGTLLLTVRDTDPRVAVSLANAVADAVVSLHSQLADGQYTATVNQLQKQISETQSSIASIDAQIAKLGPTYDVVTAPGLPPLSDQPWAEPNQLLRQRADLAQSLGALQSERSTLDAAHARQAQGAVVDPAAAPATKVAGRQVPDYALGGLLGLVVALAVAATLETWRPTLVGRDAIARNLGAPVLAEFRHPTASDSEIAEAAMHLELAAVGSNVRKVGLLSLSRKFELHSVAARLSGSLSGIRVDVITRRGAGARGANGDAAAPAPPGYDTASGEHGSGGGTGVVVVTPRTVRVAELTRAIEFFTISGWPLLGLIVVRRRGRAQLLRPLLESTQKGAPQTPLGTATAKAEQKG